MWKILLEKLLIAMKQDWGKKTQFPEIPLGFTPLGSQKSHKENVLGERQLTLESEHVWDGRF